MDKHADDQRLNILGVGVSQLNIPAAVRVIDGWITRGERRYVCVCNTFNIMECQRLPDLREIYRRADMVTPDGMPLVWLSRLAGNRDVGRVYGPDLMAALFAQTPGYRHFLYGGTEAHNQALIAAAAANYPSATFTGQIAPPFGALSEADDAAYVAQINASGAQIVWVGLGSTKQERWMAEHRDRLDAPVIIGVGAAFDFLSGAKRQAPRWMQRNGLEWLFRLASEPRRLWRRYLINAPLFVLLVSLQALRLRRYEDE